MIEDVSFQTKHSHKSSSSLHLNLLSDIAGHSAWGMEAAALKAAGGDGGAADVVDGVDVEVEEGEDEGDQVPASSLHPLTAAESCPESKV